DEKAQVHKEFEKARNVGLPVSWTDTVDLPLRTFGAVRYGNQVQFHPTKFVRSLAKAFSSLGGQIYELTRAIEIREGEPCAVRTDGGEVWARSVVQASHFPVYD